MIKQIFIIFNLKIKTKLSDNSWGREGKKNKKKKKKKKKKIN